MGNMECLSFLAGSFEWKTDWQSPSSDAARLCMIRGHIDPKHLHDLTRTFRLSPAFLVRHLGSDIEMTRPGRFSRHFRASEVTWATFDSLLWVNISIPRPDSTSAVCRSEGRIVAATQKSRIFDDNRDISLGTQEYEMYICTIVNTSPWSK
jgi:hypothetical protein